jgi:hypothetical protein
MKLKQVVLACAILFVAPANAQDASLFERNDGYWSTQADEDCIDFFGKLTEPKSQREDWYTVTPYIAEFWCTVSNAGLIYVGLKHECPEILFVGAASIASHSIPKQWILCLDKIGVALAFGKLLYRYDILQNNPSLCAPLAALGCILGTDAYLARNKGYTWPHVIWHLSAAYVANLILSCS